MRWLALEPGDAATWGSTVVTFGMACYAIAQGISQRRDLRRQNELQAETSQLQRRQIETAERRTLVMEQLLAQLTAASGPPGARAPGTGGGAASGPWSPYVTVGGLGVAGRSAAGATAAPARSAGASAAQPQTPPSPFTEPDGEADEEAETTEPADAEPAAGAADAEPVGEPAGDTGDSPDTGDAADAADFEPVESAEPAAEAEASPAPTPAPPGPPFVPPARTGGAGQSAGPVGPPGGYGYPHSAGYGYPQQQPGPAPAPAPAATPQSAGYGAPPASPQPPAWGAPQAPVSPPTPPPFVPSGSWRIERVGRHGFALRNIGTTTLTGVRVGRENLPASSRGVPEDAVVRPGETAEFLMAADRGQPVPGWVLVSWHGPRQGAERVPVPPL